MKLKLALLALATVVALSSAPASARGYRHSHYSSYNSNYRNSYNAMGMMQAPAYAPGPGYSYGPGYPYASYGYSAPAGSNLSGTGSSRFGGGAP